MYLVQLYNFSSFFQKFVLVQVYVMTFIFVITWQFAQFALLLHSLLCFILATAQLLNKDQVRTYIVFYIGVLEHLSYHFSL